MNTQRKLVNTVRALCVATLLLGVALLSYAAGLPSPLGKTFPTADDAAKAYVAACEQQDTSALEQLLGPDGKELINSGDETQDKNRRERFANMAKEGLQVMPDPADSERYLMYVGKRGWPMPIPIVKTKGGFAFDAAAGKTDLLARRVGHNELNAISFLHEYVNAQLDFAYSDTNKDGTRDYAQHMWSTGGEHDGLYWPAEDGKPEGALAAVIQRAVDNGYEPPTDSAPFTFQGYVYRILLAQGPNAQGGARDYVVQGSMIGGFAMVAYPVEYGVSGVKTFVVNQDGVVWEKDLGRNTTALGAKMTSYNPDKTWRESPLPEDDSAAPTPQPQS